MLICICIKIHKLQGTLFYFALGSCYVKVERVDNRVMFSNTCRWDTGGAPTGSIDVVIEITVRRQIIN